MAKVNVGENAEGFWIECGDDDSGVEDFGTPLMWEAPDGKCYVACMAAPGESAFEHLLYSCKAEIGAELIAEDDDESESDDDPEGVLVPGDAEDLDGEDDD